MDKNLIEYWIYNFKKILFFTKCNLTISAIRLLLILAYTWVLCKDMRKITIDIDSIYSKYFALVFFVFAKLEYFEIPLKIIILLKARALHKLYQRRF